MKKISGGVCAAKGFTAAGIHAGVKAGSSPDKNDLALILSDCECAAAATFTNNRVKAAPVYTTMNHLENGMSPWQSSSTPATPTPALPMVRNTQKPCAPPQPPSPAVRPRISL